MTTESHDDHPGQPLLGLGLSDQLGLPVTAYDAGDDVLIEIAKQLDGSALWKVRKSSAVLSKTGEWEWEPMPSSRDAEFLARCRFATPQAALACLRAATQLVSGPNGLLKGARDEA